MPTTAKATSRDGSLFAGDGGFEEKKMLLYRVKGDGLEVERLADLNPNDTLAIQPNVQFTRDDRWVMR